MQGSCFRLGCRVAASGWLQGSCLRDDERAASCLVWRQRRQHDVRSVDEVGGRAASQDDAVRVQREEVAVAVQRLIRRTAAALARREQLLVRDVLLVERVLLALQAATTQGIAQGGGQCAERGAMRKLARERNVRAARGTVWVPGYVPPGCY